jgi:hypothetical protein
LFCHGVSWKQRVRGRDAVIFTVPLSRCGGERDVTGSIRVSVRTAPTFFALHIDPFQGYHTMQISIRVSIVQVLSGVVVGVVIPKMGNYDFCGWTT